MVYNSLEQFKGCVCGSLLSFQEAAFRLEAFLTTQCAVTAISINKVIWTLSADSLMEKRELSHLMPSNWSRDPKLTRAKEFFFAACIELHFDFEQL